MPQTNDALKILDRMIGNDADMRQMIAEETLKAQIAQRILRSAHCCWPHATGPRRTCRYEALGDRPIRRC